MPAPVPPVDYQDLFRKLPENFLLMRPDATIVDNTDAHEAISFKPRADAVGRTLFEAYPSVDQNEGDKIFQSHENVRRTLRPDAMPLIRYDLERPAEQGGGFEESYWQATHYPVLDAAGQLAYILQRSQNVTAQHLAARQADAAQRALDEATDRTRFILESLPVMVWTNRPDGTPDYFNPRWLVFFGKTEAELLALAWDESTHPDDRAALNTGWARALATGLEFQLEYRLRRHDGQYRWLLIQVAPRREADGRISMWVGTATDIHEQREMVAELLEANETQAALADQAYATSEQVRQQRETLFQVFMEAPVAISVVRGTEYRYEFANRVFLAGAGNPDLVGRTVAEVFPEFMAQSFLATLAEVYRTGQPYSARQVPVHLDATADQPAIDGYVDYTYQPFFEGGQVAGVTSFSYDVTELVQARQALEKLQSGAA